MLNEITKFFYKKKGIAILVTLLWSLVCRGQSDSSGVRLLLDKARTYYDSEWNYTNKKKVDSALLYIRQALNVCAKNNFPKLLSACQSAMGEYLFRCNNNTYADESFSNAIITARNSHDSTLEAATWFDYAERTPPLDSFFAKKEFRHRCGVAIFAALKDKLNVIVGLQAIARDLLDQGKTVCAARELKALIPVQQSTNGYRMADTDLILAEIESKWGDYNNAIAQDMMALKYVFQRDDPFLESKIYWHLGQCYTELGQPEKSLDFYLKGSEVMKSIPNKNIHQQFYSYFLLRGVVRAMIALKTPEQARRYLLKSNRGLSPNSDFAKQYVSSALGDCFNAMGKYGLAEEQYLQSVSMAWHNGRPNDARDEYLQMAEMNVRSSQYRKAASYLGSFLSMGQPDIDAVKSLKIEQLWFKIDSAAGNFLLALKHFQQFKHINDSIFSERKSRQLEELEVQYQTSEEEKNILVLQNTEKLQRSELEKAYVNRIYILIGLLAILLILGFVYHAYRTKQRNNKVLESQKEEIKQQNISLQLVVDEKEYLLQEKGALLNEKERLFKEIHHRVKNNFQIVIALLYSQSAYLTDENAKYAMKQSQQRVYSIALIHQKLYQSENIDFVDMKEYVEELVTYMSDCLNIEGKNTVISSEVASEKMHLSKAIPAGLIINEAVTNAVKHGFFGNKEGLIFVRFGNDRGICRLSISDNGRGFPPEYDPYSAKSLGMTLLRGFSEQLDGKLVIGNSGGVSLVLTFKNEF